LSAPAAAATLEPLAYISGKELAMQNLDGCVNGLEPNSYVTRCADPAEGWGHYVSNALGSDTEPGRGTFVRAEEPHTSAGSYVDTQPPRGQ
jgi:hypothetical protein